MRILNEIFLFPYRTGKRFLDWREIQTEKGLEGLPNPILWAMMLLYSLQIFMCSVLIKQVCTPFLQLIQELGILPLKIRVEMGLLSIAPACAGAAIVFLVPVVGELNDEFKRRCKEDARLARERKKAARAKRSFNQPAPGGD